MKTIKSLILGSAAGLIAVGGAQAADLPVKAKAVEYVRICSLYGAGFFYIPGTDTCIKLGGYLRADLTINGGIYNGPFWNGEGGIRDRYANFYNDRSRLALTIDTRTATEYGVVRTFGQADFQFSTFGSGSSIGVQGSVNPAAWQGQVNNDTAGNGYTAVEMVFIQFAGFTFGKSASAFSTPWHGYPGNNSSFLIGGFDTVTGINNIQYSWQFGNGVSATLGIDDSSANGFNRTQIINAVGGPAGGSIGFGGASSANITGVGSAYGGTTAPDIVGNVRVDQAWGLFQISGALHDNRAGYFGTANTVGAAVGGFTQAGNVNTGHPDDKWGGAVSAALQIKNIPTGAGDDIKMDATWSLGASKYVLATSSPTPSAFDIYSGTKLAMGVVTDSIYSGASATNAQTQQQLTRGWGFRGAFNHNWDPYWSSSLFGGIAGLSYNSTAKTLYCNAYSTTAGIAIGGTGNVTNGGGTAANMAAGSSCDPGFTVSMIGLTTRWTPVKNLTFSAEVLYAYLKTNMSGGATAQSPSTALPLATTNYTYGSNGTTSLNLRVQRNF
ncbi:porin [Bradyrhizobium sp. NP1]|uniref:porin n=1 Tax=Bradyrhizobium sp. NP1 TaxID=3049772 RepID=UPI0025A67D47|nr:porin [Bradyrhizobium sp. NP1]WJR80030.1 porin [Bradyrhizobium sp. NP1]